MRQNATSGRCGPAAAGIPAWAVLMGLGGAFGGNEAAFAGGPHWQAAAYCLWEACFCVGLCLGLIVLYG